MKLFLIRLMSSLILIPFVINILFSFSKINFMIFILILTLLAAWEWGLIFNINKKNIFIWLFILFILFIASIFFIKLNISFYFSIFIIFISFLWWLLSIFLIFFYPRSLFNFKYNYLYLIAGSFEIVPFFYAIFLIKNYNIHNFDSRFLIFYIILLVFSFDSGSYIFGKLFGKHKLIKKISPKKTWEGLLGGVLTSTLLNIIFFILKPIFSSLLISLFYSIFILLGAFLGDLTESMFKRKIGIKQSGNIIPGHGGILDRLDSLIAAFPIFVFVLLIFYFC